MSPGLVLSLSLLLTSTPSEAASVAGPIESCAAQRDDDGRLSLGCLRRSIRADPDSADENLRQLEARAADEDDPRWRLELAISWISRGHAQTEPMLRRAADELAANGDTEAEVDARMALSRFLSSRSRPEESRRMLDRVFVLAEKHQEPRWLTLALLESGCAAARDGNGDLGLGRRQLRQALEMVPEPAPNLRAEGHACLGVIAQSVDDLHGARDHHRQAARLWTQVGDAYAQARATLDELWIETEIYERAYVPWRPALEDRVRTALADARAAGNVHVEATLSCMLAEALGDRDERLSLLERCVEGKTQLGLGADNARLVLAWNLAVDHHDRVAEARRMLDEVIDSAAAVADPWTEASGLDARAGLRWDDGDREGAVADWERHFAIIEALRDRQVDEDVQQGVLHHWAADYLRVSGLALAHPERDAAEIARAFDVMERLRARQLLDVLDDAGITAAQRFDGLTARQRRDVQRRSVQLGERLASGSLDEAERAQLLAQRAQLDRKERQLRQQLAREDPGFARLHQPRRPSLDEVRAQLGEHRAVLAYQVSMERGPRRRRWGGSWVLVITRDAVRAERLPDERQLAPAVRRYVADLSARQGYETATGRQLYRWLLAPALDALPPSIEELVIVPDHALHALPFAALPSEDGPLAARFRVGRVPSMTTWLQLRAAADPLPRSVLALADPQPLPEYIAQSLPVSLPGTRHEARIAVASIGGRSELWIGAQANEAALRTAETSRFAVLHVGAHTVVHEARPAESAILLSPGDGEDGALHPDELGRMDLDGTLVVLAACQGAGGRVMASEGPLGPARAAFLAGARAVVASLWPIRDDEALAFFSVFYEHLGRGATAGEAIAAARRERQEAGVPPHAWAGIVLIGDADLRLEAAPWQPDPRGWLALGLLVLSLSAFGRFVRLQSGRARRTSRWSRLVRR